MSRKFDFNKDYGTISTWWERHGSHTPKKEHLSKTGIIVEIDSTPICAGFLYNTDSKICVFEFVVSNPDADKQDRKLALELLIKKIKNKAIKRGYSLIYTSINIPAYIAKLKDAGFIEVDTNQTHMFYEVKRK